MGSDPCQQRLASSDKLLEVLGKYYQTGSVFSRNILPGVTTQWQGGCGLSLSRVPRESTTSVVTGLRAGQFPIVPAGTPALPTKIASPVFQRGRNDSIWPLVTAGIRVYVFRIGNWGFHSSPDKSSALIAIAKNNDLVATRHPGESRGPVPRAAGLKRLDSGLRRNDVIRLNPIRQNFWQRI
jgi:hypothetical protein